MPLNQIIIGNLCSVAAMISDSISGTRKTHSQMMGVQIISQLFYGIGTFVLKGYSNTAQNAVAILRNLVAMKKVNNKVLEWSLIALGVILGAAVNNRGLLGWLPIIANLEYSIAIFQFKDKEKLLKIAFIISAVLFSVFCAVILNYVGIVTNLVIAVTTLISLLKERKKDDKASKVFDDE